MAEQLYDRVPYDTHAFPLTHPRNLAAVARLRGLSPADTANCRVLELGCAAGGNLIPLAFHQPDSYFIGIDYSREQIRTACEMTEELGLSNIEFHCMDLLDFDTRPGHFDYIISHGVYSWAPPAVQDKILEIFSSSLTDNGIAFVNYLTFPGAHLTRITREIMRYKTHHISDIDERLKQSRHKLQQLVEILPAQKDPYLTILKHLTMNIVGKSDSYLLHDDLGEIYEPLYFHEFVSRAHDHHLQYVGDAEFISKKMSAYPVEAMEKLMSMSDDIIDLEQHADFLSHPLARCSLLCKQSAALDRDFLAGNMNDLYLTSFSRPVSTAEGLRAFRNIWGGTFYDPDPLFQQAVQILIDCYPEAITCKELLNHPCESKPALAMKLLNARSQSIISITVDKPCFHTTIDRKPAVSALTRLQARVGSEATSLWHENIGLDGISRILMPYLDGRHDRGEILKKMISHYEAGDLTLDMTSREQDILAALSTAVEQRLGFLARSGLLVSSDHQAAAVNTP